MGSKRGGIENISILLLSLPTPHNISPLNSWWKTREAKKEASKEASKQASMPRALLPFDLLPTSKVDWRYTRKNCTDERKLIFRVSSGAGHHLLASISSPSLSTRSFDDHHHHHHESVRIWRCVALWLTTKWFVDPRSRLSRVTRLNYARPRAWRFIPLSRRQRICNEITSGSDMRRNLTSLSTFRAVNLNSKLSD